MPTYTGENSIPIVQFDPALEISPFTLFRRLRDRHPVDLFDARSDPGTRTLTGARPLPAEPWQPDLNLDTVIFDEDGSRAVDIARKFRNQGCARVRALFGGLDLYAFALDPEVVGRETYLEKKRG